MRIKKPHNFKKTKNRKEVYNFFRILNDCCATTTTTTTTTTTQQRQRNNKKFTSTKMKKMPKNYKIKKYKCIKL